MTSAGCHTEPVVSSSHVAAVELLAAEKRSGGRQRGSRVARLYRARDAKPRAENTGLQMTIRDDGTGFDVIQPHAGHLGLAAMRERAEALGAELSVSAASETGTTVRVIVDAQPF